MALSQSSPSPTPSLLSTSPIPVTMGSSQPPTSPAPIPSDTTVVVTDYLVLEAVLPIAIICVVLVFAMLLFTIYHNRRMVRTYQRARDSPTTVPLLESMSQTLTSTGETLKSFQNKLYDDVKRPLSTQQGVGLGNSPAIISDRPRSKSDDKSCASYETVGGTSQTSAIYETVRGDNWTHYVNCNNS